MVAVVSGNSLGLFNSSRNILGGNGTLGDAATGQAGEQIFVNSATGNLIIQDRDEFLNGLGIRTPLVRTYNSQGLLDDDNGDNWRLGVHQRVQGLTGTVNTAGSTITKVFGDGAAVVYTYNVSQARYVGTDGDGAHDTLTNSAGTWTWTDGTNRNTETYDSSGRLTATRDQDGNTATYGYTGSLLTQVTDASGQQTFFDYTGTNLTAVRVISNSITQTLTRYTYDGLNRLTTVRVDLSPQDNSIADNVVYSTSYTYDGTSRRIASIAHSDGTAISFTYEQVSGQYRIKTYTEGDSGPVTVTANSAVLSTTETQTTTTTYNLNSGALTPPSWSPEGTLSSTVQTIRWPKMEFAPDGSGFMLEDRGSSPNQDLWVSRYNPVTKTWGAAVEMDSTAPERLMNPAFAQLKVDAQGNALVVWSEYDASVAPTYIYARRYDAATATWGARESVYVEPSLGGIVTASFDGNQAVVGVITNLGNPPDSNVKVVQRINGVWQPAILMESNTPRAWSVETAVDSSGNAMIVWADGVQGGIANLYARRYLVSTGTWGAAVLLDTQTVPATVSAWRMLDEVRLRFDTNGNGYIAYKRGENTGTNEESLIVRRYNRTTESWEAAITLHTTSTSVTFVSGPTLMTDFYGNAMIGWGQDGGVYVRKFSGATQSWEAAMQAHTITHSGTPVMTFDRDRVLFSWIQTGNDPFGFANHQIFVRRYEAGVWSTSPRLNPLVGPPHHIRANRQSVALRPGGDAFIIWDNGNTLSYSELSNHFSYTVPAGATWESIGQALYGNTAVASQLQAALGNPPLTAGTKLLDPPASIAVTTTIIVPVPPYYLVPAGATWTTIAQTVYGINDPNAAPALQAALGNPALTAGLHLTVPATFTFTAASTGRTTTLTYTPSGGGTRLDVQSPLGIVTTLLNDSSGRLTTVQRPSGSATPLETSYVYDAQGNVTRVTQDPTGLNRATNFEYDANGNLTLTRDADGVTVTRTYSTSNQVLTETRYVAVDPDGAGSGQPGTPRTTRYAYDSEDHLRFVISPEGRVTERRYNAAGQLVASLTFAGGLYSVGGLGVTTAITEAQAVAWVGTQDLTKLQRIDYVYDFRGQLSTETAYVSTNSSGVGEAAGSSIKRYVYDQRGRLLQTIAPRGEGTSDTTDFRVDYTYDGLGRVLTTSEWVATGSVRTTVSQYDDVQNRVLTTFANGLITTRTFNGSRELTSVLNTGSGAVALGSTSYAYDINGRLRMVTDPLGYRTYTLYDAGGRKTASVDADGTLTQYLYNRADGVVQTIVYASRLSTTALATLVDGQGKPANVTVDSLVASLASVPGRNPANDRISRIVYDPAGRVVFTIDPAGNVTKTLYDGLGRATDQLQYALPVSIDRSIVELSPGAVTVQTSATDRHSRTFYDVDGRLAGTLDAAGYLITYSYDAAGRLTQQTAYANPTPALSRATGTLASLIPAADESTTDDPERDIRTYFFYDGQGRRTGTLDGEGYLTETVYDVDGNVAQTTRYNHPLTYTAGATLSSLKSLVPGAAVRHTTSYLYGGDGQVTQETNPEGTVTTYAYNAIGNLISKTRALGTSDARTTQQRYDGLGRVVAELTAKGSSLITGSMTPAQIDAIWTQHSVRYAYDLNGRKMSATDQNGNATLFYYDVDGRVVFTVNAAGEVTESRYDAFGDRIEQVVYANRISTSSLTGGTVDGALTSRVNAAVDALRDSRLTYTYTLRGQVATSGTSEGALLTYTYNAFGEKRTQVEKIDASTSLGHEYSYDARGLLQLTRWDPTGLNTQESRQYDAFGRLTTVIDARGNDRSTEYDRLGRAVATVDALGARTQTVYDAFSRTVSTQDARGNVTSYTYNDVLLSTTLTTPEGIVVTTVHNREGQTLSVTTANHTTTYVYDVNGALTTVSDGLGTLESRTYDNAGRHLTSTDARNVVTTFTYDAANRVLTRVVDSVLALTTSYTYDSSGRVTRVVEPNGKVTDTIYDRDGRVTRTTIDALGLNEITVYSYDAANRMLTVTQGTAPNLRRTLYAYDRLGRRTSEVVEPTSLGGTLNLTTQYRYDQNGNLSRKIDAKGNSTWYVYDAENRVRFTVDALGGVTENGYDADGRNIYTLRYATPVATGGFGDVVVTVSPGTSSRDRIEQTVYDDDGRSRYTIDSLGGVTERTHDDEGNVIRQRAYATPISGLYTDVAAVASALAAPSASDRVSYTAYDTRGRAVFAVNGAGAVVRNEYDATGNVVKTTAFATLYTGTAMDRVSLQSWADTHVVAAKDHVSKSWYDNANRMRFHLDAGGYLTETRYNDVTRTVTNLVYIDPPSLSATITLAQLITTVAGPGFSSRTTTTLYDVMGRVSRVTDAVGNFDQYTYNALGDRATHTNKKGDTWNYEYDANRRLIREIAPAVALTTVSESGASLVSTTTASIRLETVMTYDALGNLETRTEAANTGQARTTSYQYDALGRQTRTTYPQVGVYNPAGDSATLAGTNVVRSELPNVSLFSEVAYDTLGNAYRHRDVAGNYSFKVFDALGRIQYDIDALGYVTSHAYDTFGNETTLTRHANALTAALPTGTGSITASQVTALLTPASAADRTITSEYDRLNRLITVMQPQALVYETVAGVPGATPILARATTRTEYDAFGNVVRSRQLAASNGTYADTYFYYDRRGYKTAEIDALGYITRYTYDAVGNVVFKSEFARALVAGTWNLDTFANPVNTSPFGPAAPAYDRITFYTYDALHRRTGEQLQNFEYHYIDLFNVRQRNVGPRDTSYTYDALGNQTSSTVAGSTTYIYYDALGRSIGRVEPTRDRGDGTLLTPLIQMKRDAYGNLVEEIRYATSLTPAQVGTSTLPTVSSVAADQRTLFQFDRLDHTIRTQDATGATRYASYTARGELAKEWQFATNRAVTDFGSTPTTFVTDALVTIYEYDALGRRTAVTDPQTLPNGDSAPTQVVRTRSTYNAFGEITGNITSTNGVDETTSEYFEYDIAGRLWKSNGGDGVDKVYLYDVSGQNTAEIRSRTVDLRPYASADAVNALSGTMRTENVYDLNGRLVEQRLAQFTVQNAQEVIPAQPTINTMAVTVPPNAVYQALTFFGITYYVVNPSTYANGGGYYQVSPPSVSNPQGVYARVAEASYSVSQAKLFHWAASTALDVVATFEYWPASNPAAVSTLTVNTTSQGDIGVNVQSLAAGSYGYRISYTRTGAPAAFATQTGTFNPGIDVVTPTGGTGTPQTARPTTLQSFDRWGEVIAVRDAGGSITEYRYNQLGQLTHTLLPSQRIVDTRVSIEESVGRPDLVNLYDLQGRLMETQGGNNTGGRVYYNVAGQLIKGNKADAGETRYIYDIFGNVLQQTDALGYRTRSVYDKAGRILSANHEITLGAFTSTDPTSLTAPSGNVQTVQYGYDQAGRRITETNGEGEVIKYWYDLNDNVIRRRTPLNFDTLSQFDAHSRKTRETDANGSFQTWSYDAFGRLTAHTELTNTSPSGFLYGTGGGASYSFTYDEAGGLTLQTNTAGQNVAYAYDDAGHIASITDTGANRLTQYEYDAAGRKSRDRVTVEGRVHQDTRITYDEMSRIRNLDDPDYRVTYLYDAAGNRSDIIADYLDHTGTRRHQELLYRYDPANRVLISEGVRTTGAVPDIVITGDQGTLITYNARGDRTSVRTRGTRLEERIWLTNGIETSRTIIEVTPTDHLGSEYYEYDGLGRLTVLGKETDSVTRETTTGNVVTGSWGPKTVGTRFYDKASRVLTETNYFVDVSSLSNRTTNSSYDDDGRVSAQNTRKNGVLESTVTFGSSILSGGQWTMGYDAANVLRAYSVQVLNPNGTTAYTSTYRNFYQLSNSYLETQQTVSSTGPSAPLPGSTNRTYNVNGELIQFVDTRDLTRTRYFANDASGQALTVIQGQFDGASGRPTLAQAWDSALARNTIGGLYNQPKAEHFFFADGHYIGQFGQLTDSSGAFAANFDVNYTPVSDAYPANAPAQVVVQTGDTLRIIATRVFGDASLWYLIADRNGLTNPDAALTEGTVLTIPNEVVSLSNTASSFKPYDAENAIGDTTPTQPLPPPPKKKKGCGILGQIIVLIVVIVVAYYTGIWLNPGAAAGGAAAGGTAAGAAGATTAAAGTATAAASGLSAFATGAISAAAGNIAGQLVGIAIGQQQGFSWKSVATAALSGGILNGTPVGSIGGDTIPGQILQGAVNSATNQGINILVGVQKSFSWRDVAIGAIAAPLSQMAGKVAGNALGKVAPAAVARFGGSMVAGVTSGLVRKELGGRLDTATILADAFGNALGNSIVERLSRPAPMVNQLELEEKIQQSLDETRARIEQNLADMPIPVLDFNPDEPVLDLTFSLSTDEIRSGLEEMGIASIEQQAREAFDRMTADLLEGIEPAAEAPATSPFGWTLDPAYIEAGIAAMQANAASRQRHVSGRDIGPLGLTETHADLLVLAKGLAPDTEVTQWDTLDAALYAGGKDIFPFKDQWVTGYKEAIVAAAERYDLPPELVAGIAYNEVGGDPLWIDNLAHSVRDIGDPLFPSLFRAPERTSFGNVSVQLAVAADTLGYTGTLTDYQTERVISSLEDPVTNILIAAKYTAELRDVDFRGVAASQLTFDQIQVIGARYNQGASRPIQQVRTDLSYGIAITKRWDHLADLLGIRVEAD